MNSWDYEELCQIREILTNFETPASKDSEQSNQQRLKMLDEDITALEKARKHAQEKSKKIKTKARLKFWANELLIN